MFRTKWPPRVNRKFWTGRHSSPFFKKLDVEVGFFNIEDCHWLPSKGSKRVIVKFPKRKDANRIRKIKKNLKGIDLSSFGIRSTLYVNGSLCKYYKMLWQKCKRLCVNKFIHTAQKMKFSIRDFLSKCDQICRKLLRTCNKWKHCGISSIVILLRKQWI